MPAPVSEQEEFEFRARAEREQSARPSSAVSSIRTPADIAYVANRVGQNLKTLAVGVPDIAISSARGLVNRPALVVRGLAGGIGGALSGQGFGAGYEQAKAAGRAEIEAGEGIVRSERLRTPEGETAAAALGNLPGVQQVGQVLSNVKQGLDRLVGQPTSDTLAAGAELATLRGAQGIPERIPVAGTGGRLARGTGASEQAVAAAERLGYTPLPTTLVGRNPAGQSLYAGTKTERTLAGLGGGEQVNARIAVRNQTITDRLAADAIKINEEFLTPVNVQMAVDHANAAYNKLKSFDVQVPLSSQYVNDVTRIGQGVAGFPSKPLPQIVALRDELLKATPSVPNIVDKVRSLREHAWRNRSSADPDAQLLGQAQRQAAEILDQELDRFMQTAAATTSNPNLQAILNRLYGEYTAARTQLSKLHDVRDAMNPVTGSIDAAVLARLSQTHRLAPELQQIADAYNAIGNDGMRNIQRATRIAGRPLTVADAAMGVVGANAGAYLGGPAVAASGAAIAALGPAAARLLAREYVLRGRQTRAIQHQLSIGARGTGAAVAAGEAVDTEEDDEQ